MAKKEFRNAGKGMRPVIGYNYKKWFKNFDTIDWHTNRKYKKYSKYTRSKSKENNYAKSTIPTNVF
jgi:hypothetical protein